MKSIPKKIDYKNRIEKSFEAILILIEKRKDKNTVPTLRTIERMIRAQMNNLNGIENKDRA